MAQIESIPAVMPSEPSPRYDEFHDAKNLSQIVKTELSQDSAMTDTIEDMSMALSGRIKLHKKHSEVDGNMDALAQLVSELEEGSPYKTSLLKQHKNLGKTGSPLHALAALGMNKGEMMLLITALLNSGLPGAEQARALRKALKKLLEEEGAELLVFASLEQLPCDEAVLFSLQRLYQQGVQGEKGVHHWFVMMQYAKNRQTKAKTLLRALAFQLQCNALLDKLRLSRVIEDLKKLLAFLTLEDHCGVIARAVDVDPDRVLSETIQMIEEIWLHESWIQNSLARMGVSTAYEVTFLRSWKGLIQLVPDYCCQDEDQKEQIINVIERAMNPDAHP